MTRHPGKGVEARKLQPESQTFTSVQDKGSYSVRNLQGKLDTPLPQIHDGLWRAIEVLSGTYSDRSSSGLRMRRDGEGDV